MCLLMALTLERGSSPPGPAFTFGSVGNGAAFRDEYSFACCMLRSVASRTP